MRETPSVGKFSGSERYTRRDEGRNERRENGETKEGGERRERENMGNC